MLLYIQISQGSAETDLLEGGRFYFSFFQRSLLNAAGVRHFERHCKRYGIH